MFPRLIRKDITLNHFKISHAISLFSLIDRNRNHLRMWLPWVDTCKELSDSEAFINKALKKWSAKEALIVGIWQRENLIGVVSYHKLNLKDNEGEIGYWLDQSCQGHGIMSSACEEMVTLGFNELGLNRVKICTSEKNEKSSAIPRRLQFNKVTTTRTPTWCNGTMVDLDIVEYTIDAKTWLENRKKSSDRETIKTLTLYDTHLEHAKKAIPNTDKPTSQKTLNRYSCTIL